MRFARLRFAFWLLRILSEDFSLAGVDFSLVCGIISLFSITPFGAVETDLSVILGWELSFLCLIVRALQCFVLDSQFLFLKEKALF